MVKGVVSIVLDFLGIIRLHYTSKGKRIRSEIALPAGGISPFSLTQPLIEKHSMLPIVVSARAPIHVEQIQGSHHNEENTFDTLELISLAINTPKQHHSFNSRQ